MTKTLSFPGLGFSIELNRVAFSIGPITIYWYGLIIAAAFVVAVVLAIKRAKRFGVNADRFTDVIFVALIAAVIGARLYYVAFNWSYYIANPSEIFKIWNGGMAIYGGLIFAFIAGFIMCKIRKVKFLPACDLAVSSIILGQAIGRWGNFVNMEAFGCNTILPWGMTSDSITAYLTRQKAALGELGVFIDPSAPVHPTFLYESLWCLLGFFVLLWFTKRRKYDGQMTLLYTAWYAAGRAVIEGLRTDSLMFYQFRVSQVLAIALFIISVIVMIVMHFRRQKKEYVLYVSTEEGQKAVDGSLYQKAEKQETKTSEETFAQEETEETQQTENLTKEEQQEMEDEDGETDQR